MENSNQKVYYSHTTKFEPVQWGVSPKATVALTLSEDGDLVFYGMTICSKDDNFSRKQGRELAEQRLKNNFGTLIVPEKMKNLSRHQICLNLVRELTYSVILKPRRWKRKITRHNILVLVNNEQEKQ